MVPSFKDCLASGEFLVGTWLVLLDPTVPELLAGSGFDVLIADGEHGPVATSDLVQMLIATRAAGVPILYRVAANEPVRIMHALDSGASGVVIPQVRTVADVERAVAWCRYPPAGLRGVAPRRAGDYGRQAGAYLTAANDAITCCIQIETREALDGLDSLLEIPGVDTLLVGPNDLAASIGHTGEISHPDVEIAIAHVIERAKAHGVPAGIWTQSNAVARRRREQGYQWVTISADYGFIVTAAEAALADVRRT